MLVCSGIHGACIVQHSFASSTRALYAPCSSHYLLQKSERCLCSIRDQSATPNIDIAKWFFLAMSSDVLWPTSRGRASCGVRCRDSRAAVARLSTYSLSPRSPSISLKKRRQVRPTVAESSTGQSHRVYEQAPKLYHPKGTGVTAAMTLAGEKIREADRTLQRALDKSNTKFLTSSMSATQWISGHGCAVLLGGVAHEAQQERVGDDTPRHHRQQSLPAPPRLAQARATRTNTLHLLQNS